MQRRTIIFLLIALFLPSVSADFLAFGDTTINAVPCGSTTANVTIQNTLDTQATYSLSVNGDASDYVTFSLLSFTLEPNASTNIQTFYNIPCNIRPGTYSTDIYFSDGDTEKVLSQELNVAIPDNVNATISQTSAVIAPCETAGYTLSLHNPLNFTEIYNIDATGHPNVHISEKRVVLQGDERKTVIASVVPEDCTQSGTFPLLVTIDAEKSNQHKEIPLELIIKSTDIPVLAEGTTKIRTDYVDSTADLSIENTGDRTTQYTLSLEGATWASIAPTKITLEPGQSKVIGLRLKPTKDITKGSYPITLTAIVEQTGIRYGKELTISLQPQTFFERNPAIAIGALVIILAIVVIIVYLVRYLRSQKFKDKVRHWKEKREAKRKAREQKKADLLKRKLEQERKDIERKQAERERIKKQVKRQIEKDFKKEYHLVARKELVVGKHKINVLKIIAVILAIVIIALIAAFWKIIAPNYTYVLIGVAILLVIFIAKKMARARVIKASWKNLISNQTVTLHGWKKGLSLLSITAKNPIRHFKMLVRKTKAKITPSPAVYQTFILKTNTPEEATTYKATFTISKRWLARKHADADYIRLARYFNQSWTSIPLKKTGEGKSEIHFTADISKQGTYSIYAKVQKTPMSKGRKLLWALVGIAVVAAVIIMISPQSGNVANGIPTQSWQQDTVHSINLATYFKDPDGDKLTYNATGQKHITIAISGTTAYLTPEPGWTGEERITFTASDRRGGTISSNLVPLRVQRAYIPASIQPLITIILAVIVIIIVLFAVRSYKAKPKK